MKRKIKISLFVLLIISVIGVNVLYKNKENKPNSKSNLAIMIKENGSSSYVSSNTIPKGDYVLNETKTICENGGKVSSYDSATGQVAFSFLGSDRCSLYFDYKQTPGYLKIINNNGGINTIKAKGTPDFTNKSTTNEGLYVTKDNFGDSYYFRGLTDNNWLQYGEYTKDYIVYRGASDNSDDQADFSTLEECQNATGSTTSYNIDCKAVTIAKKGDKMYWKIVRINGDNSIRLIYNGTTQPTEEYKVNFARSYENDEYVITHIGYTYYNLNEDLPEYVGYQYIEGEQHGYGSNATDSKFKKTIDNWYTYTSFLNNNIISDQIFCNDRNADELTEDFSEITTSFEYNPYTRTGDDTGTPMPSLICENNADKFTVSSSLGNGALTYPTGLLTMDEFILAGTNVKMNECGGSYGYMNFEYSRSSLIGSPMGYWSDSASVFYQTEGCWNPAALYVPYIVNPVINLSKDVILTGDGTYNNPYKVVE